MRVGLLQLTTSDDPGESLTRTLALASEAADDGATFILTPEVTNCVSLQRRRQAEVLRRESDDATLAALRRFAAERQVWVNIGSLALLPDEEGGDGRFHNRSFLIGPDGGIVARYDKMHMFDVAISETETYRESDGYAPGEGPVTGQVDGATVGLSICYDLRFPSLYHAYAAAGAEILTVPSAFSPVTGDAHWHVLVRARAIETGCFVLAAAQCGTHPASSGHSRKTYGHSLVVSPWGEVRADGGTEPGIVLADIDLDEVRSARARIPSLTHARSIGGVS